MRYFSQVHCAHCLRVYFVHGFGIIQEVEEHSHQTKKATTFAVLVTDANPGFNERLFSVLALSDTRNVWVSIQASTARGGSRN